MSNEKQHKADFSKFDRMSTEELEDILCQHAQSDDAGETDLNAILYISEVLVEREKEKPIYSIPPVETAWQQFQQKYLLPETGDVTSSTDIPQDVAIPFEEARPTQNKIRRRSMRAAAAAAILVILLVSSSVTASAFGVKLWDALVKWTCETFGFSYAGQKEVGQDEVHEQLEELKKTLYLHGAVKEDVLPKYLPEGYTASQPVVTAYSDFTDVVCMLSNGEQFIMFQYRLRTDDKKAPTYEKDEVDPDEYVVDGVIHSITTNEGTYQALWQQSNIECGIYGLNTKEELIRIIDSIYGG